MNYLVPAALQGDTGTFIGGQFFPFSTQDNGDGTTSTIVTLPDDGDYVTPVAALGLVRTVVGSAPATPEAPVAAEQDHPTDQPA